LGLLSPFSFFSFPHDLGMIDRSPPPPFLSFDPASVALALVFFLPPSPPVLKSNEVGNRPFLPRSLEDFLLRPPNLKSHSEGSLASTFSPGRSLPSPFPLTRSTSSDVAVRSSFLDHLLFPSVRGFLLLSRLKCRRITKTRPLFSPPSPPTILMVRLRRPSFRLLARWCDQLSAAKALCSLRAKFGEKFDQGPVLPLFCFPRSIVAPM